MNNFYLSCKECVLEGPRSFYGCFYLGPFNNSQSLTIANALRRTLLSEISGLGILNAQIEGVEHEYSTFVGIRESVLDLLLNLKEIVFCYDSDFDFVNTVQGQVKDEQKNLRNRKKGEPILFMGYLQVTGPGIVRASDLKLPSFLKCVDPDQYIGTLSENGKINLKIEISEKNFSDHSKTRNFQSSVHQKKRIGLGSQTVSHTKILKVDSVFSPIKKVNYTIQHYGTFVAGVQFQNHTFLSASDSNEPPTGRTEHFARINPNNQVICLELWTNGSIHPRVALYEGLSILNSTFSKLEKMKILNDVYSKSVFKSNENYSKTVQKTLANFIHLPSSSSLDKQTQMGSQFQLNQSNENFHSMATQNLQYWNTRSANFSNQNQNLENWQTKNKLIELDKNLTLNNFDKLKLIYLDKKEKNLLNEFSSIQILNLPFRIENCFIQADIITLSDLFNQSLNDLKQIPGLGNQSLSFLQKKLFLFLNTCSSVSSSSIP